jgi:hypothetical protein
MRLVNAIVVGCLVSCLMSCSRSSYENDTCKCWAKEWIGEDESAQIDLEEGIQLLDDYLSKQNLLGLADGSDYVHFSQDTTQIVVPEKTGGYANMKLAYEGNTTDMTENFGLYCITKSVDKDIKNRDFDDLMFRLMMFTQLAIGQKYPLTSFNDFFRTLTSEEMKHPIIKILFYYTVFKNELPKISFGKRKENKINSRVY